MSTSSSLIGQMKDKAYRDAYVRSQITTALPFQLRALRKARGLTQERLATLTGMAQSRFPSLEKPTGRMPDLDTLCRIAAAYDIALQIRFLPFSELIDWDEAFDPDEFNIAAFDEEFGETDSAEGSQDPEGLLYRKEQYQEQPEPAQQGLMASARRAEEQDTAIPSAQPNRSTLAHARSYGQRENDEVPPPSAAMRQASNGQLPPTGIYSVQFAPGEARSWTLPA